MPICNLQFAIFIPSVGLYRGQPRFHTCLWRSGSGSEVVSPGAWPSTLAVGGALSLKAVAGLRVLVNAASAFVQRIIARALGRVKSAIGLIFRTFTRCAFACPSTSSGRTAAWYFSSPVGHFSPCGAKNDLQENNSFSGQVYKTFTFRPPVFIGLSPAFAIVLVRAGVLLQVTKVETPNVAWSSLRFRVFSRHHTCPDPHDLVS